MREREKKYLYDGKAKCAPGFSRQNVNQKATGARNSTQFTNIKRLPGTALLIQLIGCPLKFIICHNESEFYRLFFTFAFRKILKLKGVLLDNGVSE